MKIALFSDIHANLPALEAVLADIDQRNPDVVYCLGDLVGYAPWPNEVIREIRRRGIATIAGNYDEGIGLQSDDCGCAYKTEEDKARGALSIAFTNQIIEEEQRAYLRSLPRHIRLEFDLEKDSEKLQVLLVHGSPRKINEYLFEDRQQKSLMRIMKDARTDILFFGHTHQPFHKKLAYEANKKIYFRHAVNIGSVGKPKDGDARACYVMLDIDHTANRADPASFQIQFIRIAYEVEKTAQAIEESPLPDAYADMLRNAY